MGRRSVLLVALSFLLTGCAGGGDGSAPQASPAKLATVHLLGTVGESGTVSGTVTYDPASLPIDQNVRGLAPNAVFALTGYALTVAPNLADLPLLLTFASGEANQLAEFCVGVCVFGSPEVTNLSFRQDGYRLQLTFEPNWGAPMLASCWLQWNPDGPFYDSFVFVQQITVTLTT